MNSKVKILCPICGKYLQITIYQPGRHEPERAKEWNVTAECVSGEELVDNIWVSHVFRTQVIQGKTKKEAISNLDKAIVSYPMHYWEW